MTALHTKQRIKQAGLFLTLHFRCLKLDVGSVPSVPVPSDVQMEMLRA